MKALFFITLIYCPMAMAQIDLPELSPEGRLEQLVGYTRFEIRYGRPAARGRKIMGELVPFKRIWRTGAGKCSVISFNREIVINGKRIPAGAYAIVTIPDERQWTVLLNRDTTQLYGDPSEYDPAQEVARMDFPVKKTERFYESLTFDIDIAKYDAILYLSWENTQIRIPMATGSHQEALQRIDDAVKKKNMDPDILAIAAFYYYMNNEKLDHALKWLDEAISQGGDRWVYHQKVDVLERQGRYADARLAANRAIEFLQRTKPQEWEAEVGTYQEKINEWPGH